MTYYYYHYNARAFFLLIGIIISGTLDAAQYEYEAKQPMNIERVIAMRGSSQTCALLADPRYRDIARHLLNMPIAKKYREFPAFISHVLKRELVHADRYYVLYHGECLALWHLQQIIKKIALRMQDLPEDSSFIYVRSPAEGLPELNVTEFLAQHNSEIDDLKHDFFDHEPIVKNMLLATNITLFGGGNPEDGESSFYFWLHNKFISFPNFRVILSTLCEKYHISAYLETLINWLSSGPIPYAIEHWQSTSGCLLQIFIPKEKFDRCVYLSKPYGIPIDPHTRASHMLDQLCAHSFDSETQRSIFSETQARLLITPSLNRPDSGIKIYRYIPDMLNEEFRKQAQSSELSLDTIVDEIRNSVTK